MGDGGFICLFFQQWGWGSHRKRTYIIIQSNENMICWIHYTHCTQILIWERNAPISYFEWGQIKMFKFSHNSIRLRIIHCDHFRTKFWNDGGCSIVYTNFSQSCFMWIFVRNPSSRRILLSVCQNAFQKDFIIYMFAKTHSGGDFCSIKLKQRNGETSREVEESVLQ